MDGSTPWITEFPIPLAIRQVFVGNLTFFFQQEALDNGHAEEHEPVLGMAFSAGSILVFFHWIMICWGVGIDYEIDLCQHEGVNTMNLRVQGDMWQIVPISSAISSDLVHEPAGRAGFHAWQFWSVSTLD